MRWKWLRVLLYSNRFTSQKQQIYSITKDIVLDISLQVASLLENQGIQVILTRQADVDLGLQPRVEIANRALI